MSDSEVLTRRQAARELGCHEDTVSRLIQDGTLEDAVLERTGRGGALRLSGPAIRTYKRMRDAQRPLDPAQERARRDRLHADNIEHDLKAKRGEYVRADEVATVVAAEYAAARKKILDLPRALAVRARDVESIEPVADEVVREALEELSDPERPAPCPHYGADVLAPAKPKRKTRRHK